MDNDFVSVLVPRSYLHLVRGFVAGLNAQGLIIEEPAGAEIGPDKSDKAEEPREAADDWTAAKLDRLVRESHSDNMSTILKTLAERPDEWVPTHDLVAAIGGAADSTTVAGALGAFGRRCYHRYGMNSLPFEGQWDHEKGCKVHRMSAKEATEILRSLQKRGNERQL